MVRWVCSCVFFPTSIFSFMFLCFFLLYVQKCDLSISFRFWAFVFSVLSVLSPSLGPLCFHLYLFNVFLMFIPQRVLPRIACKSAARSIFISLTGLKWKTSLSVSFCLNLFFLLTFMSAAFCFIQDKALTDCHFAEWSWLMNFDHYVSTHHLKSGKENSFC